jgi:cation diffusion facilitator CzcD-associated flavoprotein CzcO
MQSKTALVVGGGACGLVAAKELIEVGFDVTVIEKRDEIGGLWNFSSSETSFALRPTPPAPRTTCNIPISHSRRVRLISRITLCT